MITYVLLLTGKLMEVYRYSLVMHPPVSLDMLQSNTILPRCTGEFIRIHNSGQLLMSYNIPGPMKAVATPN